MPAGTELPQIKPATSYRWPKKTSAPNPYSRQLGGVETRRKRIFARHHSPNRNAICVTRFRSRAEVGTLNKFSFSGATDPFIVVPGSFTHARDPVKVGDLAVVVSGDAIYPAMVGDVGPNDKVGEASLRIAKEINGLSMPHNRPVSDLGHASFPSTADKTTARRISTSQPSAKR
jgi:hypothetical protein